jgi:TPR repeat protein
MEAARPAATRPTTGAGASDAASNEPGVTLDADVRACAASEGDARGCLEECDRGIAASCGAAAARYEKGRGVEVDLPRAARLYERACEGRDAVSCVALGNMHGAGDGVARDATRQRTLHERACDLGLAAACWLPARRATGPLRRAWLEKGCGGGDERACEVLERDDGGA